MRSKLFLSFMLVLALSLSAWASLPDVSSLTGSSTTETVKEKAVEYIKEKATEAVKEKATELVKEQAEETAKESAQNALTSVVTGK